MWELMGGCRTPIVYALNIVAVLFGAFLAPLRILRAIRAGRGARALYRLEHGYEELLALPLGELRRRLGIPSGGVAQAPRRLHGDGERKRADALPGASPVPGWAAALAMIYGLSTLSTVAYEFARGRTVKGVVLDSGAVHGLGIVCAVLAALVTASTPAARRGSLGGRALFGIATFGLLSANIVAAASFGAAPLVAVMGIAPAAVLLAVLARGR